MGKVRSNVHFEIVMEQLKVEYLKEKQTTDAMDSKCGILMASLGILVTLLFDKLPLQSIRELLSSDFAEMVWISMILLILITFMLITIIFIMKAMQVRSFNSLNISNIVQMAIDTDEHDQFYIGLMKHYEMIILENAELNEKKAKQIRIAIYNFVIFIIASVSVILLLNVYL